MDYILYDFDGVIANTNNLKINAFEYALRDEPPNYVKKLIKYHIDNGGITRQEKFKYYLSFISKEDSNVKYNSFLKDFSNYCQMNIHTMSLINGVDSFVESVNDNKIPQYIISGGNRDEIVSYLDNKNLLKYFTVIYGNPTPKRSSMYELYKNYCNGQGVYFGDAKLDYELARQYGMKFVFVKRFSDWIEWNEVLQAKDVTIIDDFDNIDFNFVSTLEFYK